MKTQTNLSHLRSIASLGLPLIGSHVAQFALTLTDSVMLGWYDVEVLAAQVLGGTVFFVLLIMGSGFGWAVMPLVAEAEGSGQTATVRRVTRMALWISLIYAVLVMPLFWFSQPILTGLGQDPNLSLQAQDYLILCGWALGPALVIMVLKSYLAALQHTRIVFWITLLGVVVNVVANYLFIFGHFGAAEMGIRGAALATLSVNIVMCLAVVIYTAWVTSEHEIFRNIWKPDWPAFGEVFRLGLPISLTNLAEVGLFAASSFMMGWMGTIPLAAHGIALQITSLTFMIHVGLSNVATIRAGNALGRGDIAGLKQGARLVLMVSGVMVVATIAVFLLFPAPLISAFMHPDEANKAEVLRIGVVMLAAAALFQLADAAQVMALGLLRGVKDTRVPMIIAGISYWLIGIPVSYLLGFTLGYGGVGIWLGLAVGLAIAGAFMMARFWRQSVRMLETA